MVENETVKIEFNDCFIEVPGRFKYYEDYNKKPSDYIYYVDKKIHSGIYGIEFNNIDLEYKLDDDTIDELNKKFTKETDYTVKSNKNNI